MMRASFLGRKAQRALGALGWVALLGAFGCDNSMSFTAPTAPDWSFSGAGIRNLRIHGTLQVENGALVEATVLYDGQELVGARSRCPEPGCARLELEASTFTVSGHHTISFRVLRQSQETIDYLASGSVVVSREGVALAGRQIPLRPTQARLEAGGDVSFEVEFKD